MDTAIGVFASRDRAEEAVKELRERGVPEEATVFLTRSESEAQTVAKQFGEYVGGFMGGAAGMSAGVVAASILLPGIGTVFALGVGGAALLGLVGAGAGKSVTGAAHDKSSHAQPTPETKVSEDVQFFHEVLQAGRSLIVVRTDSKEVAAAACSVLDHYGMAIQGKAPAKMQTNTRHISGVAVIDVAGRITLGEGNEILRGIVADLLEKGHKKVLLNLAEVSYVDSSGLGELVKTHTTIRNRGGSLKMTNLNKRVYELLKVTHLVAVFDIAADEPGAISAFGATGAVA